MGNNRKETEKIKNIIELLQDERTINKNTIRNVHNL